MAMSLESFNYHDTTTVGAQSLEGATRRFGSDETAARHYLDELLQRDERPTARAIAEPERPELVPGLVVEAQRDLGPLGTHQVRFTQSYQDIPVFGAAAVVELTPDRRLVSVNAELGEVTGVSPVESLSRADALDRVREYTGATIPADAVARGRLMFYQEAESGAWHLAWFLGELPAAPPDDNDAEGADPDEAMDGHGFGRRPLPVSYNFLVDAHDGEILFTYSAVPTAGPATPTRCTGIDEDEKPQVFFGRLSGAGTAVLLEDESRSVRTYDLQFADIDNDPPVPPQTVPADTSDYGTTNRAAVSAHVNAARVQDFYTSVLQRDGIDDRGMVLISLVNTTAAGMQPPPALLNAFWWQKRMWYGQIERNGRLVSLSRYLDVIGHELTHGVVESTSGLVYATQSGALNESFADSLGVIINNWYTAPDRDDVATWNWEIGAGLRSNGLPLRDFADPTRTGHPDHMNKFRSLRPGEKPGPGNDNGWVHVNSNIHNKAIHNLLTTPGFTVQDVAVLVYLGLTRLTPLATFAAALQAIVDVGLTYFGGSPDRDAKIAAIRQAYGSVGIS
ncbi:M4 family metallopeptidase [Paractinoplanes maris]|uniref:M4 family metallopeptidase n=1 Tax=Paractinoplanes maris TaxID=1734446 RepID=UPI002021E162|nr:M4 family metallopeptidase [Actinoplanes maris]